MTDEPKTASVELLELIAELNLSDDKSRQALGAEIKRLTTGLQSELETALAYNNQSVCAYCGETIEKNASSIAEHIFSCEKRPERKILDEAFKVNDRLFGWLAHVSGMRTAHQGTDPHFTPTTCDTCKEIEQALGIWMTPDGGFPDIGEIETALDLPKGFFTKSEPE